MRTTLLLLAAALTLPAPPAFAATQSGGDPDDSPSGSIPGDCRGQSGRMLQNCIERARRAAKTNQDSGSKDSGSKDSAGKGTPGVGKADAKLINETNAAAEAKLQAKDFTGAAADYQKAIEASPNNPARHILYAGLALAQRRQAIAAYNSGTRPTPPPPGASNEAIRAFNAASAAGQAERNAAALPLLKTAIASAATAAAAADASKIKAADPTIGVELREDASLLFLLDPAGTMTTPRPSAELEASWLQRWLAATNPLAESLAAKYGVAVAAALTAKDSAAGLTLADAVRARTGNDVDGLIGYAEILAAAKVPASDARRTKALADLTAVEATVADSQQNARLKRAKTALGATK